MGSIETALPTPRTHQGAKSAAGIDRRTALAAFVGLAATASGSRSEARPESSMHTRKIPSTGEALPVIGVGTWQTFDIGRDRAELDQRKAVLEVLFEGGGRMIDSSPMYGRAEATVGALVAEMGARDKAYLATKVWTSGEAAGLAQMAQSAERLQSRTIDLMQIHNLVDWRTHLKSLRAGKADGRFRHIGITHYTTSAFTELMSIMSSEQIDFVQLPYSLAVRDAEARLLPLAIERGIAVIPNRPFDGANMFQRVKGKSLPDFAAEIDATSFGQIFLKYLLGHPAITCVIPGTSKAQNMRDNIAAGFGRLPDEDMRRRIAKWWQSL
jgi:diketogulonate reductase-like aldo/keto reductase